MFVPPMCRMSPFLDKFIQFVAETLKRSLSSFAYILYAVYPYDLPIDFAMSTWIHYQR